MSLTLACAYTTLNYSHVLLALYQHIAEIQSISDKVQILNA